MPNISAIIKNVRNIMRKTDASTRAEVVYEASKLGVI